MLDLKKINDLLASLFEGQQRKEKIMIQHFLMYFYKVFRIILIASIVTYFMGCIWFIFSAEANKDSDVAAGNTFNEGNVEADYRDDYDRLIISCYFALTTLSTVGYGDMGPVTTHEQIFGIFVMLIGVAFFSFVISQFSEIIQNFNANTSDEDKSTELHNWLSLLTRFTNNKPLPKKLIHQIDAHFKYYWTNDRLKSISKKNEFLNALPRSIKRNIMIMYLFEDIFVRFRFFFNTMKNKDSKFLYDVAFGLLPRFFSPKEDMALIYDEEDEVSEMYFIMQGTVGFGYYLFSQGLSKEQVKLGIYYKENTFICDYNVCHNRKNEFVIKAVTDVEAFALSKKFLNAQIFPKYPEIAAEIKEQSFYRYKKNIQQKLIKHRAEHIEEINKKNSYKTIDVKQKADLKDSMGGFTMDIKAS